MSDFFRVNVTSATSTPAYNEWGEQKAEVEMQLPANLLANTENVRQAKMGVMKLQIPLAKLPITTMPIDSVESTGVSVNLKGYVTVLPGNPLINVVSPTPPTSIWGIYNPDLPNAWVDNWVVHQLQAQVHHLNEVNIGVSPAVVEERKGYHEFYSAAEFFRSLQSAILESLKDNLQNTTSASFQFPPVRAVVNSDNTISFQVYPFEEKYAMPFNSLVTKDSVLSFIDDGLGHRTPFPAGDSSKFVYYTIVASSSIARMLPSLPWIKVKRYISTWPEEYMWMLNTADAKLGFQPDGFQQYVPSHDHWKHGTIVTYNFPESDAISMTDVESIILVMNGTAFNQQVLPVNFSARSAVVAQTGTVPIIELYYPFWSRPSDSTSTLIVKRDDFSNSAPININPSLLKERYIKFKLFYITSSGEMREIIIPRESPFSFQIAFELTR